MPRVALTVSVALGKYPAAGVVLTEAAADASQFNSFVSTGNEILVARNTDSGAQTVTIHSVADDKGRTGDITTESIAAGAIHFFGPLAKSGWAQTSSGVINVDASSALVKFSVIQLP